MKIPREILTKRVVETIQTSLTSYLSKMTPKEKERHEIFLASIHNIRTIWLNEQQGFYDMKYILECMVHGSRIINNNELTNHTSNHFNKHFYDSIVDCIGFLTTEDREKIQKNINLKK